MAKPFKCPHCGAHDYVVVLTGCNITGATVQDPYTWNEEEQEYSFGGSLLLENESLENQGGHALCGQCEADISEALSAYEQAQAGSEGEAQA